MSRTERYQGPVAIEEVRAPFLWGAFLIGIAAIVFTHVQYGPAMTLLVAPVLLLALVPGTLYAQLCWDFYTWRPTRETTIEDAGVHGRSDPLPASSGACGSAAEPD
ncbi:hypothetical protein GCM10008019_32500 [Deinococcus soli (ex Cha et al. 2016)]|nr:hypothetical protein GCM10008019_32500 [Deinococcus soli (ex Cha et al. 2016)]